MKLHNNNINNENNNELNSNKSKPKKKKFIDREKAKELTLKAAKALDDKKL